jgi:hypothetical protein
MNDVFAGLRDSALIDLEHVKADLAEIDAPKVFRFEIEGEVYEKDGAAWARLFADTEAVCPSGVAVVYAISMLDGSEEVRKIVRDFFSESKAKGDRRSRDNLRTSQVLYVGSSRKMAVRLREHLGFSSRQTYALKLSEWYPAADLPLEFNCAVYAGASVAAVAALEDALWERMQPMYGRKGAR